MDFSNHPIIKDFNLFLNYLTARPKLSLTIEKGVLKHVDLFALNRQMSSFTSHWIQPKSNQDDFTLLNTFFYLAEASELIIAQGNQRNSKKELLFNPKRLKAYAALTDAEKYFFLLETFWRFMDWDNAYEIRSFGDDDFYKHMIACPVGKKVSISQRESKREGEFRRPSSIPIVEMFEAFGFLELEPDESIQKRPQRYTFPYKTVALTEFGAIMLEILMEKRPYDEWKREGRLRDHIWSENDYEDTDSYSDEDEDVLLMEDGDEDDADTSIEDGDTPKVSLKVYQTKDLYEGEDADDYDFSEDNMDNSGNTNENFENAFLPHLQGVTIQKRLMPLPTDLISGLYRLKVVLDKETHRIIEIGGNHTFDDLHLMIQHIFGLDNDHLYTFFMDGRRWSQSADRYASPHCLDEVPATAIKIGQVGLFEGKNFLYLFDFGDEWEFKVWVEAILPDAKELENPILISAVGDNPEQYPDYEEEEED